MITIKYDKVEIDGEFAIFFYKGEEIESVNLLDYFLEQNTQFEYSEE